MLRIAVDTAFIADKKIINYDAVVGLATNPICLPKIFLFMWAINPTIHSYSFATERNRSSKKLTQLYALLDLTWKSNTFIYQSAQQSCYSCPFAELLEMFCFMKNHLALLASMYPSLLSSDRCTLWVAEVWSSRKSAFMNNVSFSLFPGVLAVQFICCTAVLIVRFFHQNASPEIFESTSLYKIHFMSLYVCNVVYRVIFPQSLRSFCFQTRSFCYW